MTSTPKSDAPRLLVAGMGNVLHRDDGFGVEVTRRLLSSGGLPLQVKVIELGIGGISLVQELLSPPPYDILFVIDAVNRNGFPGQVFVLEAEVPELEDLPEPVRRDFLADMHYAVPDRALILAKALGVLPATTLLIGCQPVEVEELGIGLSRPVDRAVDEAVEQVKSLARRLVGDGVEVQRCV